MHKALPCQALVLDMDGVMLDSEPLWQQSEMEVGLKRMSAVR